MEKKIAVLSDIHGNHSALQAVLNSIDEENNIEHIYCLGDLIGIGYETNEVLELLFSRTDVSFVMGNHDEAILDILAGRVPYSKGTEREHHKWIAERIDHKYIRYLVEIPAELSSIYNRKRFIFTHYHLNDHNEFIKVDKEPTEEKLDSHYRTSDADVICFGHHHVIHHFKSKERLYLNPSSLGCYHKPFAPYAIITVGENGDMSVSFEEVPYDNKDFLLGYKRLNVPDSDYILNIFHGNQHLNYM
ncbi:metallophosphoesterase family protein [Neobacillus sp. PS3-40]|uniref:metallophosphoesterase family protein n=1 Tax=Neobacillus sp. PS3-40 TaxID=3070679 RepID=UPI0027E096BB|nr:metallophosphoesterase family protein [Neobacillus sp. PS3-40]WML44282.1 metallophosphoesterase family protein [Neobacillus sp. PS3-40]